MKTTQKDDGRIRPVHAGLMNHVRVTLCIDRYGSSTTQGMSGSYLYLWECARIKIFISSSPGIGINLDNLDLGTAETSTLSSIRTKS